MNWVRNHVRSGSWLALAALAVNLALSFGHVHALAGRATHAGPLALSSVQAGDHGRSGPDRDRGHPDDLCPICMAAAAMGTALAATAPVLTVQFAAATLDHTAAQHVAPVEPRRSAFYSRGPPLS